MSDGRFGVDVRQEQLSVTSHEEVGGAADNLERPALRFVKSEQPIE